MPSATEILKGLNEQQIQAVTAPPGPLLVTAGAGSGKTAVLMHRIAYLIDEYQVRPSRIMAVTFTNKAAREMKDRIGNILMPEDVPSRIGTFHSQAYRFLRRYHVEASLPSGFTIMDMDDQKSLMRRLAAENDFDYQQNNWLKNAQNFINNSKENRLRAGAIDTSEVSGRYRRHNFDELVEFYLIYESACQDNGWVDFTELLLRSVEVLHNNELVRQKVQDQTEHLLIDEFQDTNSLQLDWLLAHCEHHGNVMAVGDEDQSIYGWRGAVPHSMMDFAKNFRNTEIIRLERNYRSTQIILQAANALIKNNQNRYDKNLWTDKRSESQKICLYDAQTGEREAQYVAGEIEKFRTAHNLPYSAFAVLYRTNAQSRLFEEVFSHKRLPFRIFGGQRFYSRAEIKHVLAYLRLLVEPRADDACRRIMNLPPRGIGNKMMQTIESAAAAQGLSIWDAICRLAEDAAASARVRSALGGFVELVEQLKESAQILPLPQIVREVIEATALREYYENMGIAETARVENLDEMVNAAANYMERYAEDYGTAAACAGRQIIFDYLDEVTIDAGDKHEKDADAIWVMTLHSSKGLEFPVVFLTGMDDGLLPHLNAIQSSRFKPEAIEEERRLCYVGMTRAEDALIVTRAQRRRIFGQMERYAPSRFFKEIPPRYLERLTDPLARPRF